MRISPWVVIYTAHVQLRTERPRVFGLGRVQMFAPPALNSRSLLFWFLDHVVAPFVMSMWSICGHSAWGSPEYRMRSEMLWLRNAALRIAVIPVVTLHSFLLKKSSQRCYLRSLALESSHVD